MSKFYMEQEKVLTTESVAPAQNNQLSETAGPGGPVLMQVTLPRSEESPAE